MSSPRPERFHQLHGLPHPRHRRLTLCCPQTEVVNGAYYDQLTPSTPGPQVNDKRSVERLLKLSEKLTALTPLPV